MTNARLYELPGPWSGRLAIVPRPRGGAWLEDDIGGLRAAGVQTLVSTLTADEIAELDLLQEAEFCAANAVQYVSFPISDRGVPQSVQATADLARDLERALAAGKTVAVHCRAAIGRSAMIAACVLATSGVAVDAAFAAIEATRGCPVPDTPEQRAWVEGFARELAAAAERKAS